MFVAFYPVNNDKGLGKHSFDHLDTNKKEDCIEIMKSLLPVLSSRFYVFGEGSRIDVNWPTDADFQLEYNDENLDGGWWCVTLPGLSSKDFNIGDFVLVKLHSIDWDTDDKNDSDLPYEVIEVAEKSKIEKMEPDEVIEKFSNLLSDKYGFCHKGFRIELMYL